MWSDTVLYEPGKAGVRGFGARIYLYEENGKKPVHAEGDLIIYAFDAQNEMRMPTPEKKFVFTQEQLAEHFSKTQLGPSYSIWIPWDEVGGPPRQLSLVTRFEGADGTVVVSDPARKLLPGIPVDEPDKKNASLTSNTPREGSRQESRYSRVAYDEPLLDEEGEEASGNGPRTSATALTLEIPPGFSRKLRAAATHEASVRAADSTHADHAHTKVTGWWEEAAEVEEKPRRAAESVEPDRASNPTDLEEDSAAAEEEAAVKQLPASDRLSAHFAQRKYQPRSRRATQPTSAVPRRTPHRGEWLSGLPPTPRSASPEAADDAQSPARADR